MKKTRFYKTNNYISIILMFLFLLFTLSACNKQDNSNIHRNNPHSIENPDLIINPDSVDNSLKESSKADSNNQVDSSHKPSDSSEDAKDSNYIEVTLAMVGDMLLHDSVHKSGEMADGSYNYDHLFDNVRDEIKEYDIAIVNQEVILGGRELGLSGYPTFNGAYEIADSLVDSGFNVILHATNHTLDKGKTGVLNCLNYWKTNYPDIAVLGINESQGNQDNIYVYEKDDLKIAILNYTYGTNGVPLPSDMPYIVNLMDKETIENDVRKANEIADFVVVAPHWGTEYIHEPSQEQIDLATFMADIGVDLVIGAHPHVVQPVEWIESNNGNKMLIYYSLGNYINATASTGDGVTHRMVGTMADVTIRKNEGEEPFISDYSAIPLISHKDTSGPGLITVYLPEDYSEELANENEIKKQDPKFTFELVMDVWNNVYPKFAYNH